MNSKHMTIIGAGPKSIAIATKAYILSQLGFKVPEITILEKEKVAANWLPGIGLTNGQILMASMYDTDLGFPYNSSIWGEKCNREINYLMQRFSWQNFLIFNKTFASWVDHGRPIPDHTLWASYLQWAIDQVLKEFPQIKIQISNFQEFEFSDKGTWLIKTSDHHNKISSFETDGIVITGPGEVRMPEKCPSHPRILNYKTFWQNLDSFENIHEPVNVAIIGNGESAATMAIVLDKYSGVINTIDFVTPIATTYSRGESFSELHMYTNPVEGGWFELTLQDRMEFINRTDHGVFTLAAKHKLDKMKNVRVVHGRVNEVHIDPDNKIILDITYNNLTKTSIYDYVIFALGFDPFKFITLKTSEETRKEIAKRAKMKEWNSDCMKQTIATDLSVSDLFPKLHLPLLSGLKQGPGYPCACILGSLSDQILFPWTST